MATEVWEIEADTHNGVRYVRGTQAFPGGGTLTVYIEPEEGYWQYRYHATDGFTSGGHGSGVHSFERAAEIATGYVQALPSRRKMMAAQGKG